jgi:hypothetical protein
MSKNNTQENTKQQAKQGHQIPISTIDSSQYKVIGYLGSKDIRRRRKQQPKVKKEFPKNFHQPEEA